MSSHKEAAYKGSFRSGADTLADKLAKRKWITPNALTIAGLSLCLVGAVVVHFQHYNHWLIYWLAAAVFGVGSLLDVLDGALARRTKKATVSGQFLDSSTDRLGEFAMLGSIALIFGYLGDSLAEACAIAAIAGSFQVSYIRAKAEKLGIDAATVIGERAERLIAICAGLVLAPWGGLRWVIYCLVIVVWFSATHRFLGVYTQIRAKERQ